jgi:hypothetical protein
MVTHGLAHIGPRKSHMDQELKEISIYHKKLFQKGS